MLLLRLLLLLLLLLRRLLLLQVSERDGDSVTLLATDVGGTSNEVVESERHRRDTFRKAQGRTKIHPHDESGVSVVAESLAAMLEDPAGSFALKLRGLRPFLIWHWYKVFVPMLSEPLCHPIGRVVLLLLLLRLRLLHEFCH